MGKMENPVKWGLLEHQEMLEILGYQERQEGQVAGEKMEDQAYLGKPEKLDL